MIDVTLICKSCKKKFKIALTDDQIDAYIVTTFPDTCEECQKVLAEFVDATDEEKKLLLG